MEKLPNIIGILFSLISCGLSISLVVLYASDLKRVNRLLKKSEDLKGKRTNGSQSGENSDH